MSKATKVNATKDYAIFHRCDDNRPMNLARHKKLADSLKKYGFLKSFPLVCQRDAKGRLVVKDGQHRLAIAQSLGIAVWWIEEDVEFDIATVNCTAKTWVLRDYAERFAQLGNKHYVEGLDFAKAHGIPVGIAFAMLAGTVSFGNIEVAFTAGDFKVKDRPWADTVAATYGPLVELAPAAKSQVLLLACMAVARVPGFDPKRMTAGATADPGQLKPFAHRDEFLAVLEELYNHKRSTKNRVPLKFLAAQVMTERNRATGKAKPGATAEAA